MNLSLLRSNSLKFQPHYVRCLLFTDISRPKKCSAVYPLFKWFFLFASHEWFYTFNCAYVLTVQLLLQYITLVDCKKCLGKEFLYSLHKGICGRVSGYNEIYMKLQWSMQKKTVKQWFLFSLSNALKVIILCTADIYFLVPRSTQSSISNTVLYCCTWTFSSPD